LERDDADHEEEEDEEQGEVEPGEHRRVPGGEGSEGRAAGDDEPDFVAVPDGPDRLEHGVALALLAGEEREQHADAEVQSLEQEVAAPEDGYEDEPEGLEVHQYAAAEGSSPVGSGRSGWA